MKPILFSMLLMFSVLVHADSSQVSFSNGWIKHLPPVVPMRAGYIDITNKGEKASRIVAVQSPAFETVEMHETTMADGIMKMKQLESFELPASQTVALKPGGRHLMLIQPQQAMAIGDKIDVIISFSDGETRQIQFEVKQ